MNYLNMLDEIKVKENIGSELELSKFTKIQAPRLSEIRAGKKPSISIQLKILVAHGNKHAKEIVKLLI